MFINQGGRWWKRGTIEVCRTSSDTSKFTTDHCKRVLSVPQNNSSHCENPDSNRGSRSSAFSTAMDDIARPARVILAESTPNIYWTALQLFGLGRETRQNEDSSRAPITKPLRSHAILFPRSQAVLIASKLSESCLLSEDARISGYNSTCLLVEDVAYIGVGPTNIHKRLCRRT